MQILKHKRIFSFELTSSLSDDKLRVYEDLELLDIVLFCYSESCDEGFIFSTIVGSLEIKSQSLSWLKLSWLRSFRY